MKVCINLLSFNWKLNLKIQQVSCTFYNRTTPNALGIISFPPYSSVIKYFKHQFSLKTFQFSKSFFAQISSKSGQVKLCAWFP